MGIEKTPIESVDKKEDLKLAFEHLSEMLHATSDKIHELSYFLDKIDENRIYDEHNSKLSGQKVETPLTAKMQDAQEKASDLRNTLKSILEDLMKVGQDLESKR